MRLTSMRTHTFTVAVLPNAVKMANKPPLGVKANVQRAFLRSSNSFITEYGAPFHWQRLLYNLASFHAIILERRQFGPLGFNIPYEFNESDLLIFDRSLQVFVNQSVVKNNAQLAAAAPVEAADADTAALVVGRDGEGGGRARRCEEGRAGARRPRDQGAEGPTRRGRDIVGDHGAGDASDHGAGELRWARH
jgi:hypothetical protein